MSEMGDSGQYEGARRRMKVEEEQQQQHFAEADLSDVVDEKFIDSLIRTTSTSSSSSQQPMAASPSPLSPNAVTSLRLDRHKAAAGASAPMTFQQQPNHFQLQQPVQLHSMSSNAPPPPPPPQFFAVAPQQRAQPQPLAASTSAANIIQVTAEVSERKSTADSRTKGEKSATSSSTPIVTAASTTSTSQTGTSSSASGGGGKTPQFRWRRRKRRSKAQYPEMSRYLLPIDEGDEIQHLGRTLECQLCGLRGKRCHLTLHFKAKHSEVIEFQHRPPATSAATSGGGGGVVGSKKGKGGKKQQQQQDGGNNGKGKRTCALMGVE